jgi:predicted phage terminase large subunit-like protein
MINNTATPALFAMAVSGNRWYPAEHLLVLSDKLVGVANGDIKRLMVTMPPRHGKSELISKYFPAWYLGHKPDNRVILSSYEADFAATWGAKARNVLTEHGEAMFGVKVSYDSSARNRWDIDGHTGGMATAGVGGAITGKGAHIFLIDDPIKNNEEAKSKAKRDKIDDWFKSTAYTRLEPNASMVIIQCMTGDTRVLMADGSEHFLSDIRKGDMVATYDTGKLSTSRVVNHLCSGKDIIYKVILTHGKQVRANERHPFLAVEDGKLKWIRLKDLNTDHRIVILKDSGASGKERCVWPMDAKNQQSVRDIVCPTTIKRNGRMGIVPRRQTLNRNAELTLNTGMVLPRKNMLICSNHRMANVPSASNHRVTTCGRIGVENCVSTMTTIQERSEHCYATIVTSPLGISKTNPALSALSNTSDFTTAGIERIEPDGIEDVFDVEIEHTGNFIANGVVSHNTRWNEDDLAGRRLEEMNAGGEKWELLDFPAIAKEDDILGRKVGEALFPRRYPIDELMKIKRNLGSYWWHALYQQTPTPDGGDIFKRSWFRYFKEDDEYYKLHTPEGDKLIRKSDTWILQTCDPAATENEKNDFFVLSTWAVTKNNDLLLLEVFREHADTVKHEKIMKDNHTKWNPRFQGVENKTFGLNIIQKCITLGLPIKPLKADTDKISRARPLAARYETGTVYHRQNTPWLVDFEDELIGFPNAKHDDQVDTAAYAYLSIMPGDEYKIVGGIGNYNF